MIWIVFGWFSRLAARAPRLRRSGRPERCEELDRLDGAQARSPSLAQELRADPGIGALEPPPLELAQPLVGHSRPQALGAGTLSYIARTPAIQRWARSVSW